ncbi:MAG: DUF5694 domain-containing protein [Pyrinomonadaceae bacterium]
MKQIKFIFAALLVCAASFAPNISAQIVKQTKPVVMILGSYHMGNPGRDLSNIKADDVRAPKRQKEIADFLALLKKFKPTRIAVEIPPSRAQYLEHYQEYLDGKYELAANEVDQIGFRLAKEFNHKQLYTIDWQGNFDFDKLLDSAKTNGQEVVAGKMTDFGKAETVKFGAMLKDKTVTELFRYLNDGKTLEAYHRPYLEMVAVGAGNDYTGAEFARDWYERNFKIYANISRLAQSNDERILVIIGAGHAKLLQQFVTEAGDFDLEKLSKYL